MRQRRKLPIRRIFSYWLGPSLAMFLGVLSTVAVLLKLRIDHNNTFESVLVMYMLFLPMALYFSAQNSYFETTAIEKRIDELERKLRSTPKT